MRSRASVNVALVRPLFHALEGSSRALAALFAATSLTPERLSDPEARISPARFRDAWAEAIDASGDPALALWIAERTPPGAFGIVEYVCRAAPTLGQALHGWCRYLGLLDDSVEVGLVDRGSRSALRVIRESEAPAHAAHELCFALVVLRARAMSEGFRALEIRFAHPAAPGCLERHRAFFGAPVRFSASHTELILERSALEGRLSTADPNLLSILLPAAEERRGRPPALPLADQVRRTICTQPGSDGARLEAVARRLGMTQRSLQRRLKEEGTVFQRVRDEARMDLADRYLSQGLSFAEISFLLGFSEPSAFFRAFKRWTGLTPVQRRIRLQQEGERGSRGQEAAPGQASPGRKVRARSSASS